MDISYRWLRQYVDVEDSPKALANRLTRLGLEVDAWERVGSRLDGVVVGTVRAVRDHPNADRLVLCDVDLGDGEPVQIACGAPNVVEGQKAPVATVGTTLHLPDPDDPDATTTVTVEARSLRGEPSNGMICAEDELGLSDDHSGIMVLDDAAPVGQPFAEYLQARGLEPDDAVLDIDLTPNRPDAASHLGVARDVAAHAGTALQRPDVSVPEAGGTVAEQVTVHLDDPAGCPRYVAMRVRDVTVRESPLWLKRRLTAIGLRPRNNVVDITNFVLHECGQPLHAFDLGDLADDTIAVRSTESETTFTTLDDVERTLPAGTLLICDAERPVAVAGVMGGANSEVTETTTDVLIESAYFDPSSIRRTAKALNVQTDSSYRFERGVDRNGQRWAAARAATLIATLGDGTVVPGCVDAHPEPPSARTVTLRPNRLRQVLGAPVDTETAQSILEALGFAVDVGASALHCTVPTWRPDVSIEEDLIEEVARLYGYDRIPEPDTVSLPNITPQERPVETLRRDTRGVLRGRGLREIYTNSMLRTEEAARFLRSGEGGPRIVETMNPISEEMAALRPCLLPGALEVMQFNRNHGREALRVFEFGHVYRRAVDREEEAPVPGVHENEALLVALSGPTAPTHWDTDARDADLFDLKGIVELLLADLPLDDATLTPRGSDASPNGQGSYLVHRIDVMSNDEPLGMLGQVQPDVADDYDLDTPVFVAEFDWDALVEQATDRMHASVAPVSRFPVVERDLAVLVHENQPVGPLLDGIRTAGTPLLKHATVFDVYNGEGIPSEQKSVAFTLRFGADRTLTDDEVDDRMQAMVSRLNDTAGATLREKQPLDARG